MSFGRPNPATAGPGSRCRRRHVDPARFSILPLPESPSPTAHAASLARSTAPLRRPARAAVGRAHRACDGAGGESRTDAARPVGGAARADEPGAAVDRPGDAQEQRAWPVQHAGLVRLPAPADRRRLLDRPARAQPGRGLRRRYRRGAGVRRALAGCRSARGDAGADGARRGRSGLRRRAPRFASARPGVQRRHAAAGPSDGERQGDARLPSARIRAPALCRRPAAAAVRPRQPGHAGGAAEGTGGDPRARPQHRRRKRARRRVCRRRAGVRRCRHAGGRHRHVPEQGRGAAGLAQAPSADGAGRGAGAQRAARRHAGGGSLQHRSPAGAGSESGGAAARRPATKGRSA